MHKSNKLNSLINLMKNYCSYCMEMIYRPSDYHSIAAFGKVTPFIHLYNFVLQAER